YARSSSLHDPGWHEFGEVLQPQTCGLRLSVSEHPWLDDLVRLSNARAYDANGVFNSDPINWRIHQRPDELQRRFLLVTLFLEPACAADGKVCAGRMRHHQVPSLH